MAGAFAYSIFGSEDLAEVPRADGIRERLLDERHLSKSALRAFELLEFFAERRRPARATEIAQALGLSPSSADQLLKSLASRAYLIFDCAEKLYSPSPRLLRFSSFLGQSYFGGPGLAELMQALAERTNCSVSICTPFGRLMQLVDFVAPSADFEDYRPGRLFQMFNSAAGAAMLATWPIATVRSLVEQSEDQLGALSGQPEVVLAYLDEVRANGHACGGLTEDKDRYAIAVALPRSGLGVELTLTLRGAIDHMKAHRWHFAALIHEAVSLHLEPGVRVA